MILTMKSSLQEVGLDRRNKEKVIRRVRSPKLRISQQVGIRFGSLKKGESSLMLATRIMSYRVALIRELDKMWQLKGVPRGRDNSCSKRVK